MGSPSTASGGDGVREGANDLPIRLSTHRSSRAPEEQGLVGILARRWTGAGELWRQADMWFPHLAVALGTWEGLARAPLTAHASGSGGQRRRDNAGRWGIGDRAVSRRFLPRASRHISGACSRGIPGKDRLLVRRLTELTVRPDRLAVALFAIALPMGDSQNGLGRHNQFLADLGQTAFDPFVFGAILLIQFGSIAVIQFAWSRRAAS